MIVMGIDPSLSSTGFALINHQNSEFTALETGEIKTYSRQVLSNRVARIFQGISLLIESHRPDEVAVEEVFYAENAAIALKMGHARGAALAAAAIHNLPVAEYTPRAIKMAVTGYGNASKEQVRRMVKAQIRLKDISFGYDISDALAVALCHCTRSN